MSRSGLVVFVASAVLAVAGCGGAATAKPATASTEDQVAADVRRYADQTAVLARSSLTNAFVTTAPCGDGLVTMQGVYRLPLWITRHPAARADLRDTWLANGLPITQDSSSDGYLGAIGTVTPDGYTIDVVSITPKPRALSLQVRSPCLRLR